MGIGELLLLLVLSRVRRGQRETGAGSVDGIKSDGNDDAARRSVGGRCLFHTAGAYVLSFEAVFLLVAAVWVRETEISEKLGQRQ
jgi:hypothetical protein